MYNIFNYSRDNRDKVVRELIFEFNNKSTSGFFTTFWLSNKTIKNIFLSTKIIILSVNIKNWLINHRFRK